MSKKITIKDLTYSSLFAALIIVLGFVSIPLPFSPVPVTGQTLAIMLAGCILTKRQAIFSVLTFLFLGIIGLPVFAGGIGGIGVVFGPRGGYLIGFLVGVMVISLLKGKGTKLSLLALANVVGGIIVVYAIGVIWLSVVAGIGLNEAIVAGALPFIPGDIAKVVVATPLALVINERVGKLVTA
ncbi:biotin transport system substrate-specific component [Natronincola peptidivorans]|uniref:Biotin transporter n=1 Tax=Natronincola peptidivorans TaxID=426128 RepID=A0A1I0FNG7_9FIRM|nr:biotin transporter BioY [Natronincola peptidivorans]SET59952.1 biotin transport system substrate-specific component [Natronincola peptidivorans]